MSVDLLRKGKVTTARVKQRAVLVELPPDLYMALKTELKLRGRTVREWVIEQIERDLKTSPAWREFLAQKSR